MEGEVGGTPNPMYMFMVSYNTTQFLDVRPWITWKRLVQKNKFGGKRVFLRNLLTNVDLFEGL